MSAINDQIDQRLFSDPLSGGYPGRLPGAPPLRRLALSSLATAGALLSLDLAWLGVVAHPFYRAALGSLQRDRPNPVAAVLFYALYMSATVAFAVVPARRPGLAAKRGALLGLLVYASYELTNWSVLRGWPAALVPVDTAWGVALTAAAAWIGSRAWTGLSRPARGAP